MRLKMFFNLFRYLKININFGRLKERFYILKTGLMDKSKTSILMVFHSVPQAKVIEGLLKSNGISCFLSNENGASLTPFFNDHQGSIKLHVIDHEIDTARGILTGRWKNEEVSE